ncbi:predicted protein [Uncinocarpus reesii 1704]|uniref:Carrier domain-containing protein n=1 Tax=Uncinocarpus reesii (strain UAMH 1704) TaxID=336963 RepID=C4JEZ0_UNCRE|nr:uncharacterized protein UREG_00891 [Uncinocarpus reesii 1704]EEP76043.1 predicted protein [Uncinocarpus reesii 1704]
MDNHPRDVYTAFPELDYAERCIPRFTQVDWNCGTPSLSLDVLVHSWAGVLRALTGEEVLVFNLDGEPIKVGPEQRSLQKATTCSPGKTGYTGISTVGSTELPHDCILQVRCSLEESSGTIVSSGSIPAEYLLQIGGHLETNIRKACKLPCDNTVLQRSVVNAEPRSIPGPLLLHDMVKETSPCPDLALEFLDKEWQTHTLTYEQLHAYSLRLSLRISEAVGTRSSSNPVVPVLIPQSLDLYVSWLGILKAGATVCPLNIDAPSERIAFIVKDVSADVVITVKSLMGRFSQVDKTLTIIAVDDNSNDTVLQATQTDAQICPESLAYIMYTSGSTGLPKGVGLSHRAVTQSLLAHDDEIPHFRRFLQFAAPTFDVSVFEIFFPLFRGATLVACERSLMLNDLVGVMNHLKVDGAELTPTVAGELLRRKSNVPSLRVLLTIGEMLTRRVIDEFGFTGIDDGILFAMYGPTETAIHCTVAPKLPSDSRAGNIGVPFRSVSAFIIPIQESVDGEPDILPIGCIGELVIGGPQLANGYLNRPEENHKAFIESQVYGRLYRTGDRARLHPSGEFECLGRISSGQVKLRGQRMELGEVESTIFKAPGVRNTVACVINGILVAFVSQDVNLGPETVRRVCETWLPRFMVPSDIIHMDELPRLPSGKVDRQALENIYVNSRELGRPDISSRNSETERKISACVGSILNTPIDSSGSLVALGFDSLKAIRLASELRTLGINIDVNSILRVDSVQEIAKAVEGNLAQENVAAPSAPIFTSWGSVVDATSAALLSMGISSKPQYVVPCSPVQVSMIAESMKNKEAYSNWIEIEFNQNIQLSEIREAFCFLAEQNEILRSGFVQVNIPGHTYTQVIWKSLNESVFAEYDTFCYGVAFESPLQMLSPLQVQLKVCPSSVRALVCIHHALYDGWSWEHIMHDLETSLEKKPPKQRPQYREFVNFVYRFLESQDRLDAADYWRDLLRGVAPLAWPNFQNHNDIPRKLSTISRTLNIAINDLDTVVRELRVSRQTVFQGALGYLLGEYHGTSDIIFGSVSSGRTIPVQGIEDMVGPCISTLPVRINMEDLRNVQDLLATIHNINRKALIHGLLPLRDIKAVSGVDPSTPLFDTLIVWQDTINENATSNTVKQIASQDFLELCLTLEIEIKDNTIIVKATFQESVLPVTQVDILLLQIKELAATFIRDRTESE